MFKLSIKYVMSKMSTRCVAGNVACWYHACCYSFVAPPALNAFAINIKFMVASFVFNIPALINRTRDSAQNSPNVLARMGMATSPMDGAIARVSECSFQLAWKSYVLALHGLHYRTNKLCPVDQTQQTNVVYLLLCI